MQNLGVTLKAETGIGSSDALETAIDILDATNDTSGNIAITELDTLQINKIDQDATGTVVVQTTEGNITVVADQSGVAVTSGELTLSATGTSDNDDLIINDTIVSTSGKTNLDATNDVIFSADGDVSSTSGEVEVSATDAITMVDGTVIDAGSGIIDLDADETIALGQLKTTNTGSTAIDLNTANGAITDVNGATNNIISGFGSIVT